MKPRRILSLADTTEILDCAADESALAVVTVHGEHGWQSLKCRFLERDPNRRFFVLDYQSLRGDPLPQLRPGQYVGISFRRKSRKVLFTTVVEATGSFLVKDETSVPAIRYRWPEVMTELQRRAYYRTPVPKGVHLPVSLWLGGQEVRGAAQRSTMEIISGEAMDMSCGGALIRVDQVAPPKWLVDTTLGVELHLPDGRPPILLDAYYRGMRHDGANDLCLAVQFVGMEMMANGQALLTRIMRCIQQFNRSMFTTGSHERNYRPLG